ncbi:TIGR02391 family protein [Lentzea sp. NPDC005914]|uniref:TIGR02391 family protein n=1 Tax=Lentzea sp. NPDC005914 TaxID=3154572 RepID=UPI0033FE709F
MIRLSPADALALPTDSLAMIVLADIVNIGEWNEYNYLNLYRNDLAGLGYARNVEARRAIAEATGWLRARGMIARTPDQTADAAIFVTRWGREALGRSVDHVNAVHRLQDGLHSMVEAKARQQFLLGEYENAIFGAMRAVEVRVRKLSGFGDDMFGVSMMTRAFGPNGPLADPSAPSGEVQGTMMLFAGAYAVLRNPSGHREVSFDDVTEAAEAVQAASLLMRILDRVENRLANSTT